MISYRYRHFDIQEELLVTEDGQNGKILGAVLDLIARTRAERTQDGRHPCCSTKLYHAFSNTRDGGSGAAIVPLFADNCPAGGPTTPPATEQLQAVATLLQQPATVFVSRVVKVAGKENQEDQDRTELEQQPSTIQVECRFFSTQTEYQMCGHGALALAHWLSDEGFLEEGPVSEKTFEKITVKTPEKTLDIERHRNRSSRSNNAPFMMTLAPATGFVPLDEDASRAVLGALLQLQEPNKNRPAHLLQQDEVVLVRSDFTHIIVPFRELCSLRSLQPDFARVTDVCKRLGAHTVAVFWKEPESESRNCSSNTDVVKNDVAVNVRLRDFCPAVGTDEAAATGTTARAVVCYLHERGALGDTRQEEGGVLVHRVTLEQGHEMGRPSQIACELVLSGGKTVQGVRVGGAAVRVAECRGLLVPGGRDQEHLGGGRGGVRWEPV